VDVFYRRHDGKTQNGLDAVWQHAFGTKMEYPKPRYPEPIIMDPASFRWLPNADAPGVDSKHLGTFTERGVWAEILRLRPGASLTSHADARRLLFVLSGSGTIDGAEITLHSAIQLERGEAGRIICKEALELLVLGLPAITTAKSVTNSEAMTEPA
jgi:hypothetical protein